MAYDPAFDPIGDWHRQQSAAPDDPFAGMNAWAASRAAERPVPALPDPTDSPVPDSAFGPVPIEFTEEEANPTPHFDFSEAEANPAQPIDPYPVQIGRPTNPDLGPQPIDPYAPPGMIRRAIGAVSDLGHAIATPGSDGDVLVDSLAGDDSAENVKLRTEGLTDLYANDAGAREQAKVDRAAAMEAIQAKRLRESAEAEQQALEDNVKRRDMARAKAQTDRAQIEQDAKAMAASPFGQFWESRTTGGKIMAVISAIFGGLMQSKTGGRNSGLDMLMKFADDDAAAKWKSMDARREMNGEAMADADADFRTQESLRLAGREQVLRALEAELASYDPEGSHAIAGAESIAAMRDANARAMAAAEKEAYDRADKMIGREQEQQKIDHTRAKDAAEFDLKLRAEQRRARAAANAGNSGSRFGDKSRLKVSEWIGTDERLKPMLDRYGPDTVLTGKEVDDIIARSGKLAGQEIESTRNVSVQQATDLAKKVHDDEREIAFNGGSLYQYEADGKTVKRDEKGNPLRLTAQTKEAGEEIRKRIASTVRVVNLQDQAKAIRDGASAADLKWPGSKARQRLLAIADDIIIETKSGTQGMSSDSDMMKIARSRGAAGIVDYLSQKGAIEQGRANAIDGLNTHLQQRFKYNGPPLDVDDPNAAAAPQRDDDAERLNARDPSEGVGAALNPVNAFRQREGELVGSLDDGTAEFRPALPETNKTGFANIVAAIERGDKDAPARASVLADAATKGPSKAVRNESASALWKLKQANNPAAVAAYSRLSDSERAALIVHLPPDQRDEAWDEMKKRIAAGGD